MSKNDDDDTRRLDAEELFAFEHGAEQSFMGVNAGATLAPGTSRKEEPLPFEDQDKGEGEQSGRGDPWNEDIAFSRIRFVKDDGSGVPESHPALNAAGQPAGHAVPLDDETAERELDLARREGWLPDDDESPE